MTNIKRPASKPLSVGDNIRVTIEGAEIDAVVEYLAQDMATVLPTSGRYARLTYAWAPERAPHASAKLMHVVENKTITLPKTTTKIDLVLAGATVEIFYGPYPTVHTNANSLSLLYFEAEDRIRLIEVDPAYTARIYGSPAVARGRGAVAAARGGVAVGGDVTGGIHISHKPGQTHITLCLPSTVSVIDEVGMLESVVDHRFK